MESDKNSEVESKPSQAESKPSQVESKPSQPKSDKASKPKSEKSSQPKSGKPSQPKSAKPSQSKSAQPSQPKSAQPSQPKTSQPSQPISKPEYVPHRIKLWEEIKQRNAEQHKKDEKPIKVTLPDGKQIDAIAFKDSPLDVAGKISKTLQKNAIGAKVNDVLWDVWRPLEDSCSLSLFGADTPDGQKIFSHSSAHILGEALELKYGVKLCTGPPLEGQVNHFFYEARMPDPDLTISDNDFDSIKALINSIIEQKQPFERLVVTKEEAIELMKYNPYKLEILKSKVPDGSSCSIYRSGDLIDPCKGPHVPNTSYVGAFDVTLVSSSYWHGDAQNDQLQRVYGVSFRTEKEMKQYKEVLRLAEERDHRKIGKAQELFFFHPWSPGSCFFLPHGTRIYNKLQEFIRGEYRKRGFTEVVSPNIFDTKLWETSGHWEHYQKNMFSFELDKAEFALKPMNCPGHCLMFKHRTRSYRELPIRLADFGVLHRNEAHGALTGLTRVRRFQQDDAHIFCTPEQIKQEIEGALDFLTYVYGVFGFQFSLELSTRPTEAMGSIETWNAAEDQLKQVLDGSGRKWKLNPGDGAFYGPKIDIHVKDALGRTHQCATIQLDFQLPLKFELSYQKEDGSLGVPVIVHRAIFGSLERMMAILMEHTGGKWPFWLSPRQVIVVPVDLKYLPYAEKVKQKLHDEGYYAEAESSDKKFNKKIRDSQLGGHTVILVVGAKEEDTNSVNVRTKDGNNPMSMDELLALFADNMRNKK